MTDATEQLLDRLERHATDAPESVALREIGTSRKLTYAELHEAATRLASALRREVGAGSVVMLRCPNRAEYHIAFLAALAARVVVFPVPVEINPRELEPLAVRSGAASVMDHDLNVTPLSDHPCISRGDGLMLQSSGTTGLPKIVHRSAASLDAVAAQMVAAVGLERGDRVLGCVPLCHSYGLEHGLLAPVFAGATVHLARDFDLAMAWSQLVDDGITHFPAVPSVYEMLANLQDAGGARFTALRTAYSAGGPLPASVFERLQSRLGMRVSQLYGATEIGSVTFARADDPHFAAASVGRAMDDVELRIDPDGQLLVRARSMMSGYVDAPSPFTPEGFFPTGDLARLDVHGNLFITGRLKLLIDVGGLKVNPLEVEQTVCEHPGVSACVVVPMRLSETVFRIKAIVTPRDSASPPSPEALRTFTRERLSVHKVPRVFELRDALPRSATGKILRHLLVEPA